MKPFSPAPLREVLERAGLAADKRFGQHFLLDLNICRKIVRLAGPLRAVAVIEVGPGPGGLTRALIEAGARVLAVEKDPRFIPILDDLAATTEGRLRIVHADALKIDERALIAPDVDASVVANLPYNVATPLLIKWLTGAFRPARMTLMFQKEVAQRIVAAPGEPEYGRLGVLVGALCEAKVLFTLPPQAFTPPPKVASAVVSLTRRPRVPSDDLIDALQAVTQAAFGQRRKMLRSALRPLGGQALCGAAGIDASARAETLHVADFLRLAECLREDGRR